MTRTRKAAYAALILWAALTLWASIALAQKDTVRMKIKTNGHLIRLVVDGEEVGNLDLGEKREVTVTIQRVDK
jgi:hypothetical protein